MLKAYAYHKPGAKSAQQIPWLREAFSELQIMIEHAAPPSRERSLALTNLEQASMWTMKAIVHNDPESVAEINDEPVLPGIA